MVMLRPEVVRCVSFDAFGTLLHVRRPVGITYARLAEQHAVTVNADVLDAAYWRTYRRYGRKWPCYTPKKYDYNNDDDFVHELFANEPDPTRRWWYSVTAHCIRESAMPSADNTIQWRRVLPLIARRAFDEFAKVDCWSIRADTPRVLRSLVQRRPYRLAVISNFDERLYSLLDQLGLGEFFDRDAVFLSAETKLAKPDVRVFEHAVKRLGLNDPAQLVHVGDSPQDDCEPAMKVGCQAVEFRTEVERHAGDQEDNVPVIHRLSDLLHLL